MRCKPSCAFVVLSLLSTACVQSPANVQLKGQYMFGKNGQNQYQPARFSTSSTSQSSYSSVQVASGPTQQTARIDSIGVSDLPPPPQKDNNVWASKTASQPEKLASDTSSVSKWQAKSNQAAQEEKFVPLTKREKGGEVQLMTQPKKSAFIWPVSSKKVISSYGPKGSGKANDGINIASAKGEPVWAVAGGEIVFVGDELSGYGNMVLIKHADGYTTTYAHLNQATVEKYDRVKQGDIIGYVGSTGNVKNPQLYFAVRDGKQNVDPQEFLSRNVAGL